ncbi:MAG: preprotein translocase subunit SecE [Lachnospiraceae bacterium]|jgi:preprotein translocase subunit SecE|nr:preprotein translocase subunit SecE [Lachnospiraceae bacterium]
MADTQNKPKKNFFKGVRQEFKKISWPGRDEIIKQTIVVSIITFIVAVLIAAIDFGIRYGINFLTSL